MVKWLAEISVAPEESQNFYHFHDNRVLPPGVDQEKAKAEGALLICILDVQMNATRRLSIAATPIPSLSPATGQGPIRRGAIFGTRHLSSTAALAVTAKWMCCVNASDSLYGMAGNLLCLM